MSRLPPVSFYRYGGLGAMNRGIDSGSTVCHPGWSSDTSADTISHLVESHFLLHRLANLTATACNERTTRTSASLVEDSSGSDVFPSCTASCRHGASQRRLYALYALYAALPPAALRTPAAPFTEGLWPLILSRPPSSGRRSHVLHRRTRCRKPMCIRKPSK